MCRLRIHIILASTCNYKFLTFYVKIANYHHMTFMIHIKRSSQERYQAYVGTIAVCWFECPNSAQVTFFLNIRRQQTHLIRQKLKFLTLIEKALCRNTQKITFYLFYLCICIRKQLNKKKIIYTRHLYNSTCVCNSVKAMTMVKSNSCSFPN